MRNVGTPIDPLGPKRSSLSEVTSVLSGAPFSFQSGMSRVRPDGSRTAPERICAPTSEPFSSTTTLQSASSCLRRIAADKPAGPAPTITTSYSILSRSGLVIPFSLISRTRFTSIEVVCSAKVIDRRNVTSSNGTTELRYVIQSNIHGSWRVFSTAKARLCRL